MADAKRARANQPAEKPAQSEADKAFVEKAKSVTIGRGSKAAAKEPSYSLFDAQSGKKLLSGVPRSEAAGEKTRLKNEERRNSLLQPE